MPSNMQLVPISTAQLPTEAAHRPFNIHQTIPFQPSTLTLTQQQLFSYALSHLPTQRQTDISLIQIWIPALQHFTHSSKSLKASPLACCAVWLARNDCNPAMVNFSRYLYAQGLQEVRTALRAPRAILEDETLGACLALACFEVFECPGQSRAAYEWHRRASVDLLQMRGAKMHRVGIGHELFLAVRLHGVSIPTSKSTLFKGPSANIFPQIFYAFEQKEPNFLCTREWSTVPWQLKPKDDFHRLADILARGPQLLHEAADLPRKPLEQSLPTLLTILSRLLDIDADLETFYNKLETEHIGPLYWEVPSAALSTTPSSPPKSNFNINLTFPSLPLASLLTLYWSIEVMVWSALEGIHSGLLHTHTLSLLPTSPQTRRFKSLAPTSHWLLLVQKIVRSIDYSMNMTAGSATPPGIGVALEIVIDVMRQKPITVCEEELGRALGAREEMGRRWAAIFLA